MNSWRRWCRFNLVGVVGMGVQLGSLALLNHGWPGHYLWMTAIALELTLLHNFAWHERYTWRERSGKGRQRMTRLLRFHLSNGAISLVGNLVTVRVLVKESHCNVLIASCIAIVLCSLANFAVGDRWIFKKEDDRKLTESYG